MSHKRSGATSLLLAMSFSVGLTLGAASPEPEPGGDFDERMAEAIRLNDAGHYDEAVAIYKKLLVDHPKQPRVLYEAAFTSFSGGKPKEAIDYAEQCLKMKCPYAAACYLVIGSAYDAQGEVAKGEKAFRRGLRESPHDGLLHYNLGVNLIQQKKTDAGIVEILEGIEDNPAHASSWNALGVTYQGARQRSRAFVAYARFLTLEPDTARSRAASPQLWALLFEGVTRVPQADGTISTNIAIPMSDKKEDEATASEGLMLSMVAASRHLEDWEGKSDAQYFAHAFDQILAIQGELDANGKKKDPLWTATAGYFDGARKAGHLEAMAYDVRRSTGDPEILKWLGEHGDAVGHYREWSKGWKPAQP